jgi:hypothetical protein
MPCDFVRFRDGTTAWICSRQGRGRKPKPCCVCGRDSTRLCDHPVPSRKSGTCDAPLCDDCTTVNTSVKHLSVDVQDEFDLCPKHAASSAQLGLFEGS